MGLALVLVLNTSHLAVLVEKLGDTGLAEDLYAIRLGLGEVLELLHLCVGDGHTGELSATTVSTGLRVTTETRNLGEVELETVHEPVDGLTRLAGQDLDQVITGKVTGRLLCVFKEGLGRVWDALLGLCGGTGTVDSEVALVELPPKKGCENQSEER